MWRQTVNFSANEISWILLLTNERARKVIDNDSVRLNKIQFFLHTPQFPLHQGPARLTILICYNIVKKNKLKSVFLCVCPLIDDDFRHNIVKMAVDRRAQLFWQCYEENHHQ